jgi:hypothetical protein
MSVAFLGALFFGAAAFLAIAFFRATFVVWSAVAAFSVGLASFVMFVCESSLRVWRTTIHHSGRSKASS